MDDRITLQGGLSGGVFYNVNALIQHLQQRKVPGWHGPELAQDEAGQRRMYFFTI